MTDSWWLKLDRAEHHLKEVDFYVAQYSDSHPYEAIPTHRRTKGKQHIEWLLRFTDQPDERLGVVVGDVVHNLRSALDHLFVAVLPKKFRSKPWAAFPFFGARPFDDNGHPLHNEEGERWAKLVKHIPAVVKTQIEMLQPFQVPSDEAVIRFCEENGIKPRDLHSLGLLNRLDNADKHRALITFGKGLADGHVTIWSSSSAEPIEYDLPGVVPDGAVVAHGEVTDSEVEVEVKLRGTARVAIVIGGGTGGVDIPPTLNRLVAHVRDIARFISPHARP